MKQALTFPILSLLLCLSCTSLKKSQSFNEHFTKQEYYKIAKAKGITNERWIDRLYGYEVNINNFDKFKEKGIDLATTYGNDYKSMVLRSEVILEGKIFSETEDSSNVMFHTEYQVAVEKVIKKMGWESSDTVTLKVIYGPIGNGRALATTSGTDRYQVGEHVLLYLEPMEKTFKAYERSDSINGNSNLVKRINADRNDPNIFQPLKKYMIKDKGLYERTNGFIGKKSTVYKEIKSIVSLNILR